MELSEILRALNDNYDFTFDDIAFLREAGSTSYAALSGGRKYFLHVTSPYYSDTARHSADVHLFLQKRSFPVPPIISAKDGRPFLRVNGGDGERLILLYEFIAGDEASPERCSEAVGALAGQFHVVMRSYPGELAERGKRYYIDEYVGILRQKRYPLADEFAALGEELWERVKDLPRGVCHGDMYPGNAHRASADGKIYLIDFDTVCRGFPMYDITLYCNMTDYFTFKQEGYAKSRAAFARFLPEYEKRRPLTREEISAFPDLLSIYHFALQAAIISIHGLDCVDEAFFDRQLDWLYKWRAQCQREGDWAALANK